MRKDKIVSYFKVLPLHIPGGTEKATKTSSRIFRASTEIRNEYHRSTRHCSVSFDLFWRKVSSCRVYSHTRYQNHSDTGVRSYLRRFHGHHVGVIHDGKFKITCYMMIELVCVAVTLCMYASEDLGSNIDHDTSCPHWDISSLTSSSTRKFRSYITINDNSLLPNLSKFMAHKSSYHMT